MRSFILALLLCVNVGRTDAGVRFDPERIEFQYYGCSIDTTLEIFLVNDADTAVSGYFRSTSLSIVEGPEGWHDNAINTINADETLRFLVRLKTAGGLSDQVQAHLYFSGHYADVKATRIFVRLDVKQTGHSFADIRVGDTRYDTITIGNPSPEPRTLMSLAQNTGGWEMTGFDDGFVLQPGATTKAVVKYTPRDSGQSTYFNANFADGCTAYAFVYVATSHYLGVQWTKTLHAETITGCPGPTIHELRYFNTDPVATLTIDSIAFIGNAQGWSFTDGEIRNATIAPRDTLTLRINRPINGLQSKLAVYVSGARGDTMDIRIDEIMPRLRFTFGGEELILRLKPNEALPISPRQVKNVGKADVRIRAMDVAGDDRWTVQPIDTTQVLRPNGTMDIYVSFSGASDPGLYPMTVTLHGDPCEMKLTQKLVVQIGESGVDEMSEYAISIERIGQTLEIDGVDPGASILLTDLLGRTHHFAHPSRPTHMIDLSNLSHGGYVLSITNRGSVVTKKFVLEQ